MPDGLDFTDDEIDLAVERLRHFIDAVLEPDGLYEIRPVPHTLGGSIWTTPADLPGNVPTLMAWNRTRVNPYFSLNPRKTPGATKGIDTLPGSLVVADFDSGLSLAAAQARIDAAGLPPATAVVQTSADHWHFYWRLAERLPDLATHKRIQRGLAEALDTCPNVCSHQQVMRLPGPFCNVKPDRPAMPRVEIVACDPNRIYEAGIFSMTSPEPAFEAVPLERLAIAIEKNSLSDGARALVENGRLFPNKGRRASIFEAARDMHARGWELDQAAAVLMAVGGRLGLEPDDQADIPRQVRNAFATPTTPGFAVAETATIQFPAAGPITPVAADDYDADLEAMPLPEAPALPPRPARALGHGIIGDFMRRVEFETEAHPVALAATLLVARKRDPPRPPLRRRPNPPSREPVPGRRRQHRRRPKRNRRRHRGRLRSPRRSVLGRSLPIAEPRQRRGGDRRAPRPGREDRAQKGRRPGRVRDRRRRSRRRR
ncbi:MAG: DNA-primase RepB domain-containing protein [Planctomycetota bacterium]